MARKINFEVAPNEAKTTETLPEQVSRAPALSGMAKSLQAAASASVRDIDVALIEGSAHQDRLAVDRGEIEELAKSIRQHGQLVPILVSPIAGGKYRIVYGRRRLEALRLLGQPAKALVRDLNDDQAIIAQGQENSLRKDLTWIEKAAFARQLLDDGKSDALVCDALNIDQKARSTGDKLTNLSRMKQVALRISPELIAAVGPAPSFGRDRWYALAQQLDNGGFPAGNQASLLELITKQAAQGTSSDERFKALEAAATTRPEVKAAPIAHIGSVKTTARQAVITISATHAKSLHEWIRNHPQAALDALVEAQSKSDR